MVMPVLAVRSQYLLQVRYEGAVHRLHVGAGRDHAGHDVQGPAFEHPGIVQRLVDGGGELGLAAGKGGQSTLALAGIARRHVEQRLRELVLLQFGGDLAGRRFIGKQDLDGLETVRRRGAETLQERHFLVDPRKIGGELGHSSCPIRKDRLLRRRAPGRPRGCVA